MGKTSLTILSFLTYMSLSAPVMAADSYRYMHVTIDTPWMIFLFLLVIILFPFILMVVLYWYFAFKKSQEEREADNTSSVD